MTRRAMTMTVSLLALSALAIGFMEMANAKPTGASSSQCSVPVAERTDGWFCP
jgi:hypothetical protein